MQQRHQTILVLVLLFVFAVTIGVTYWLGEGGGSSSVSSARDPVKKLRAKPGTQREGARAILSSVPSVPEETTTAPVKIWGSLDSGRGEDKAGRARAEEAASLEASGATVQVLHNDIEAALEEGNAVGVAYLYGALAAQHARSQPPRLDLAEEAYQQALSQASGPDVVVFVVSMYAGGLLDAGAFQRLADLAEISAYEAYPFSAPLLRLALIRGMALEKLDRSEEALVAYQQAFDASLRAGPEMDPQASSVFRQVSLRLARLHREQGNSAEAKAIARRLRALLGSHPG